MLSADLHWVCRKYFTSSGESQLFCGGGRAKAGPEK
jgi:hypothetical protein